ncbi:MAG TPA: hypothetical protein VMT51_00530 [Dongiaceae bacterium]|nr:hypothetical protein [Dongiaceae bacterium]
MNETSVGPRFNPGKFRRSQRIYLSVRITVSGVLNDGVKFQEETSTLLVNSHGALIVLGTRMRDSQALMLRNSTTNRECRCRVVETVAEREGRFEIAIELTEAVPNFWPVVFPPDDWTIHHPEARRISRVTRP